MMRQTLTTDVVEPRDQLAYWTDVICSTYVKLECESGCTESFMGSIDYLPLPGLDISVVRSGSQRVKRTAGLISRAIDDYTILNLQIRGQAVISQDGRQAILAPGDFAIYDTNRPYTLEFNDDFEEIVLKLKSDQLRSLLCRTEGLTATTISGQSGAGRLMGELVRGLRQEADTLTGATAAAVVSGVINVLVGGLQSLPLRQHVDPSALAAYHIARIKQCIEHRKQDPALRIEAVAAELGMSVSHLHRLFSSEPLSPAQYLWSCRLGACSKDLLDPRWSKLAVSEIAFRWGFNDAAHFSRVFKDRYGCSPKNWRTLGGRG
ncbi:helix-turn-helix domain-containing protein [Pseudomonas canadensis]|nr:MULTISPECIES: helix-turn-helix domain-containing protein [Pseudomonas]